MAIETSFALVIPRKESVYPAFYFNSCHVRPMISELYSFTDFLLVVVLERTVLGAVK